MWGSFLAVAFPLVVEGSFRCVGSFDLARNGNLLRGGGVHVEGEGGIVLEE